MLKNKTNKHKTNDMLLTRDLLQSKGHTYKVKGQEKNGIQKKPKLSIPNSGKSFFSQHL